MPKLIIKPSDTQWLAHKCCAKVVKENLSLPLTAFIGNKDSLQLLLDQYGSLIIRLWHWVIPKVSNYHRRVKAEHITFCYYIAKPLERNPGVCENPPCSHLIFKCFTLNVVWSFGSYS